MSQSPTAAATVTPLRETLEDQGDRRLYTGLALALLSAAAFGTSGALAKGLLQAGWSPAAAVAWRIAVGGLALLIPAALTLKGRWASLRKGWPSLLVFGVLAVAGCQLAYFMAVERLTVAVALLIEFCGVLLVVLWLWLRRGQRPRPLTILGAILAILGLMLVLDIFGQVEVDLLGALWALFAAAGLAAYFLIAAHESHGIPPLAMATGGLLVGTVVLVVAGAIGIVEMRWVMADVALAGTDVPWWFVVGCLGLIAAAFAYASGVIGSRRLGSKMASFIGLSEVLFAVFWAWLLLGELPAVVQLFGGVLILAGVVAVRLDERATSLPKPRPSKR